VWADDQGAINALSINPDGTLLAAGTEKSTVRVWNLKAGLFRSTLYVAGGVTALAYSPDGTRLAAAGGDGLVRVWEVATDRLLYTIGDLKPPVNAIAWNRESARFLVGDSNGFVRLFEAGRGREIRNVYAHTGAINSVQYSPSNRYFVTTGLDNRFAYWDITTGALSTSQYPGRVTVRDALVSPDSRYILSVGDSGKIFVYSTQAPYPLISEFGPGTPLTRIVWKPGSTPSTFTTQFAVAGNDKSVRVFDIANGLQLAWLAGHPGEVRALTWTPDGKRLLSGDSDGNIFVWEVSSLKALPVTPTPTAPPAQ
jgi:WD40 repeat protein